MHWLKLEMKVLFVKIQTFLPRSKFNRFGAYQKTTLIFSLKRMFQDGVENKLPLHPDFVFGTLKFSWFFYTYSWMNSREIIKKRKKKRWLWSAMPWHKPERSYYLFIFRTVVALVIFLKRYFYRFWPLPMHFAFQWRVKTR